jgi:hypothetical protein
MEMIRETVSVFLCTGKIYYERVSKNNKKNIGDGFHLARRLHNIGCERKVNDVKTNRRKNNA